MKLTIIIPCYNEEKTIKQLINKILALHSIKKQIIVVDDCSTDNSFNIINSFKSKDLLILKNEKNLGKGGSINVAKEFIEGDIVAIQDADLEYDPNDLPKLMEPIINSETQVVYGSRVLGKKYFENIQNFSHWFRIIGNIFLTKLSNLINKQSLTDAHTCYKVFNRKIFSKINLEEKNFNFCPEVTTKISKLNIKIIEKPISYTGRRYSEGKKIKSSDGLRAIITLIKYRFLK
tara:strand:+ start:723 stop:1421 length:699 start_codon:yes stop_codon:yes gene_type:complete